MDGEIRSQDAPYVVRSILASVWGRGLAWEFVKGHWETMRRLYPPSAFRRLFDGVSALVRPEWEAEVRAFFPAHGIELGGKILEQYLEQLRVAVRFREREAARIAAYLVREMGLSRSGRSRGDGLTANGPLTSGYRHRRPGARDGRSRTEVRDSADGGSEGVPGPSVGGEPDARSRGRSLAPAEARDLLILRSELRRGELLSCDATACRLDKTRSHVASIVMIGLGDPPLPIAAVRNP